MDRETLVLSMVEKKLPGLASGEVRAQVRTVEVREPYRNYFSVQEHDVAIPRFDGGFSDVVTRAVFVSGDAVCVLPYDPERDRVMVIEQYRFGPHVRGDTQPWKLEAIAGRIDPGETPEQTAMREMVEETGLHLRELIKAPSYYPAPGAVAEYMYSFIGLVDLPDGAAGIGGLEVEAEDIKSHILSFDGVMELLNDGRADTGPLVVSLLWLAAHRESIRKGA